MHNIYFKMNENIIFYLYAPYKNNSREGHYLNIYLYILQVFHKHFWVM